MARFEADYDGIGQFLTSDEMQLEMHRRAMRMQASAEADAPYDPADKDGDHYHDHFTVTSGVQEPDDRHSTRRAVGVLTNDHPASYQIEVGTKDTPAHRTVTRSLDAAGD